MKAKQAREIARAKAPGEILRAKEAEEIVQGTSLMNRVERIIARCENVADTAKPGDWQPVIAASRELRGCLELLGKLSGEIQTGTKLAIGINNTIALTAVRDPQSMSNEELKAYLLAHGGPVLNQQLTQGENHGNE